MCVPCVYRYARRGHYDPGNKAAAGCQLLTTDAGN